MAITYSDFLTQVRNFTEVDSNVLTDTIIGQFIRNTELDIAGKVDYDDTRKYATSSFTGNKRYLVTPADFLLIRSLQVFSTTDQSGTRTFMEKRDTSFITEFNGSGATGLPKYYANWDETSTGRCTWWFRALHGEFADAGDEWILGRWAVNGSVASRFYSYLSLPLLLICIALCNRLMVPLKTQQFSSF